MPKISVIMPVYNGEKYLREAIDSILGQTFGDFEFIIIDDGSKDSSPDIVRSYRDPRIRFVQNECNMGVAATLNRGLDLACREYIARMDADDISLPQRFEKQVAYMDAHPEVAVCGCALQLIGAMRGVRKFAETPDCMRVDMLFSSGLAHPTVMMRGSVFGKGGLYYDPVFSKMEDYALWVETLKRHDIAAIPEILFQYRIHPQQVTQRHGEENRRQSRELKRRQLETMGMSCEGNGFELFAGARACSSTEDARALNAYLRKIAEMNARTGIYDREYLQQSLEAIKKRNLDRLPFEAAWKVVGGVSAFAYAARRVLRRMRATLMSVVDASRQRKKLRTRDFTILSNNCWAGFVYQKYGLKYHTPTIGLYIPGDDFVRFCADWQEYLKKDLTFIPWESARLYPQIKENKPYPVAFLGDVEIYFMHYNSEEEAREKWQRRIKRVMPENVIFKLSQRECCTKEDVERFMALPLKNKICFAYDEVPGATVIPQLRDLVGDETPLVAEHFDELDYLNRL